MKKNSLLKAIGIVFAVYVVLSWIIPTGYFSSGEFATDATDPVGLIDLIKYPVITFTSSVFVLTALNLLIIGGLYGVLNKTGAYTKIIDGIVKKFKGKEKKFLIISIMVFAILASLTGLTTPLFVLVPFFAAILLLLGFNGVVTLLGTAGAILVGNMASTFGFNINGYITYFLSVGMNDSLLYRFIFLIITLVLYTFVVLKITDSKEGKVSKTKKTSKKPTKKEEKNTDVLVIPFYTPTTSSNKKSVKPIIIIGVLAMIYILVGMYNWSIGLNVTFFDDIYESIMSFEIGGYTIFANIIGTVDPIGYLSNYDLAVILLFVTGVITLIYKISLKDAVNAFVDGVKKMVPVACYAVAACIIFLLMNSSSSGYTIFATISNFFLELTDGFNAITMGIVSAIGGLFYNDFPYMLNALYSKFSVSYTEFTLIGMIGQTMHGLVMLIAPTSIILVAGLTYLNVSYKEWFKTIWKYLLYALGTIVFIIVIMLIFA
ncbi:MAG: hypothetical protein ACK5HP_00070 [Bacilli bacterium]